VGQQGPTSKICILTNFYFYKKKLFKKFLLIQQEESFFGTLGILVFVVVAILDLQSNQTT
jgi:hypothetical protein